jgi:hypothetical protein
MQTRLVTVRASAIDQEDKEVCSGCPHWRVCVCGWGGDPLSTAGRGGTANINGTCGALLNGHQTYCGSKCWHSVVFQPFFIVQLVYARPVRWPVHSCCR